MTVAEFLQLADPPGGRYELRHGEPVVVPFATHGHQTRRARIFRLFDRLAGGKGEAGAQVWFQTKSEHEFWKADVGFIRDERARAVGNDEYLMGAPDVVVEVLSSTNTADEINDRKAVCLENDCASFWVVDAEQVRVLVAEGGVTRHYAIGDSFYCAALDVTAQVRDLLECA
jgi:Uma2 family endonuclease